MRIEALPKSAHGWLVFVLGLKDLWHDRRVSGALTLSIVSVVTPLLLLFGLKTGVVETLREILLKDPRNLEVIIFENTRLPNAWFDTRRAESGLVRFVIPRTRTLNTMADVENQDNNYLLKRLELIPTAAGDPLLPTGVHPPATLTEVLLTHAAAAQLAVEPGGTVTVWLRRKLDGIDQREGLPLKVAGIVPESAFARPALFVTLGFLEALEDYRDGYAAPALHVGKLPAAALPLRVGEASLLGMAPGQDYSEDGLACGPTATPDNAVLPTPDGQRWVWLETPRQGLDGVADPAAVLQGKPRPERRSSYASARLYAQSPEAVITLADRLRASGIEVRTRGEDIARLQAADQLLGRVLGLIAAIALIGGYLAFGGAIWITIERKRPALALLRLIGLNGAHIIGYCLYQAAMLGALAFAISYLLYWLGAQALNHYGARLFLELLQANANGVQLCQLPLQEGLFAAAATLLFTLAASLLGAIHAKSFQPAECLREV